MDRKIFVKEEIKISMNFENVLYEVKDGILYLTLNRPEARNALSPEMWRAITAAVQAARRNAPHTLKIEVEVESLAQMEEAIAAGADSDDLSNLRLLLGGARQNQAALGGFFFLDQFDDNTVCKRFDFHKTKSSYI